MAWTLEYDDENERAESDEFGNVRITDKVTGQQYMSPRDPAPTNPPDVAPIPQFQEPPRTTTAAGGPHLVEQYEPGMSPEEIAVRFPGVPYEDVLAAMNGGPSIAPPPAAPQAAGSIMGAAKGALGAIGDTGLNVLRKFDQRAPALDAAHRLGLTEKPTVGEVVNPAYAAVKRAAGAAGAASVEVPRMAEAVAPVAKKVGYGAIDVLNTPVGERPQFGAAEAAAAPAAATEEPAPPEIAPAAIVMAKPPAGFRADAETAATAPPPPSREDFLRSSIDALLGEKPNYDIDADRWFNGLSTGQKALAIISAAAGGFAEGFRGVPNRALETIQAMQAADVRGQEVAGQRGQDERRLKLTALLDELGLLEASASKAAALAAKGEAAGKTLPAGEAAKLGGYAAAYEGMDRVFAEWDDLGVTSYLQNVPLLRDIPTAGKRYQQSSLPPEVASLVQGISGQDATDRQYERFLAMYPQAGDSPAMGEGKKQALRLYIAGRFAAARRAYLDAGYDVEKFPASLKGIEYKPGSFEGFIAEHPELAEEAIDLQAELGHVDEPALGIMEVAEEEAE